MCVHVFMSACICGHVHCVCNVWMRYIVFAGQQVRILGENFTLEDEEDSKIGQVIFELHQHIMCM